MNTQIIHMKVILVADPTPPPPPPPTQRGTFLTIEPTADSLTYGFYKLTLADGHESGTIDWDDGTIDILGTGRYTHTYDKPGTYTIKLSDDFAMITCSASVMTPPESKTYPLLLKKVVCNAELFTEFCGGGFRNSQNLESVDFSQSNFQVITPNCFGLCHSLGGRLDLPQVSNITAAEATLPFKECDNLAEIHFGSANEEAIRSLEIFKEYPQLGAPNAVISFDL